MRSGFHRVILFQFLSVDFKYAGQREKFRAVCFKKLVWGLLAAFIKILPACP